MSGGADVPALVASLGRYLGQEVAVVDLDVADDAFSCRIRSRPPSGTAFRTAWEGVLGMQHFAGEPDVSAYLFLFSHGERVRLAGHRGSYLVLVHQGPLDGTGTWRNEGWIEDGFGEFDAYERYGED
ncbi:hypothetical protein [Actinomadura kijaniata]|uniref:hypothetical protein n=1 Tax=Actinomadura kijaniata TaxID=46161 RepID=UPI00082D68BA|nr:hypothetical protein [Actinomadura kijaniata]